MAYRRLRFATTDLATIEVKVQAERDPEAKTAGPHMVMSFSGRECGWQSLNEVTAREWIDWFVSMGAEVVE